MEVFGSETRISFHHTVELEMILGQDRINFVELFYPLEMSF
jgi:hypothetical protein